MLPKDYQSIYWYKLIISADAKAAAVSKDKRRDEVSHETLLSVEVFDDVISELGTWWLLKNNDEEW